MLPCGCPPEPGCSCGPKQTDVLSTRCARRYHFIGRSFSLGLGLLQLLPNVHPEKCGDISLAIPTVAEVSTIIIQVVAPAFLPTASFGVWEVAGNWQLRSQHNHGEVYGVLAAVHCAYSTRSFRKSIIPVWPKRETPSMWVTVASFVIEPQLSRHQPPL
jgi:hypothetical protein